jgi:hypothetical protein
MATGGGSDPTGGFLGMLQGIFGTTSRQGNQSTTNTTDSSTTIGTNQQETATSQLMRSLQAMMQQGTSQQASNTNQQGTQASTGASTTTNTGNTTTVRGTTNQAAIDRTVQQMLEGTSGLSSIFGAQSGAGVSGSSTAGLMTSDLMARVAGEVGKLTGGSETTTGPSSSTTSQQGSTSTSQTGDSSTRGATQSSSQTANQSQTDSLSSMLQTLLSARESSGLSQTQSSSSGRSGGLCYITTASTSPNSESLAVLRRFRDKWMLKEAPASVELYYQTAPVIVQFLESLPNRAEIYALIRTKFIYPAVRAIRQGRNRDAFVIYSAAVLILNQAMQATLRSKAK